MRPDEHWAAEAASALKASGRRAGGARNAVIEALATQACAVSAEEICGQIAGSGTRVGRASVYRALEALADVGHVERVAIGDGSFRWERTGCPAHDHHHHHMVCRTCGEITPFEDERLERALAAQAGAGGFRVESHDVTLHGICQRCAKSTGER